MNRRLILTLSIIIIIVLGIFLYFTVTKSTTGNTVTDTFKSLLPFGTGANPKTITNTPPTGTIGQSQTQSQNSIVLERLRHLTTLPIAGSIILEKNQDVIKDRVKTNEKAFYIRYIERATGHIFDIKTDSPAAEQISNTTIPKIYEATFMPGGTSAIARFLANDSGDQIITYYITLKDKVASTSPKTGSASTSPTVADKAIEEKQKLKDAVGIYLEPDIREIGVSPSGSKILSLLYTDNGGIFRLFDTAGKKPKTVLAFPLREWLISFPTENKAVITTKPSGLSNGYSYVLDIATGSIQKILGDVAGLTILPNKDLNTFLGAGSPNNILKLFVYFKKTDETKMLSLSTLPEKCAWMNTQSDTVICAIPKTIPPAVYPDSWYQGKTSFNDDIWKINIKTGETTILSVLEKEAGEAIDATNLELSSDDTYLTFINKKDLTLWGLNLGK